MNRVRKSLKVFIVLLLSIHLYGCGYYEEEVNIEAIVSKPVQNRDSITFTVELVGDVEKLDDVHVVVKHKDAEDTVIHTTKHEDINLDDLTTITVDGLEAGETYFIKVYASYSFTTRKLTGKRKRIVHDRVDESIGLGGVLMEEYNIFPKFLHIPESIVLEEGESFDLSNYDIKAIHEFDGDLTNDITFEPLAIETLPKGTYTLTLYVSCSNDNESTVDIELIIN